MCTVKYTLQCTKKICTLNLKMPSNKNVVQKISPNSEAERIFTDRHLKSFEVISENAKFNAKKEYIIFTILHNVHFVKSYHI